MKNKKIVIYGGSFNPPHIGHAIALETAMRLFSCDEFWILPSGNRRDKGNLAAGRYRLTMWEIILKELFPKAKVPIRILSLEVNSKKLTTTLETKLQLEKRYPKTTFYFLLGSDILADIKGKWVNGKALYNTTNFITILKPGAPLPKHLPQHLTTLEDDTVWPMITSTFIRKLIHNGYSPLPYVSSGVAAYIKKHRLYR